MGNRLKLPIIPSILPSKSNLHRYPEGQLLSTCTRSNRALIGSGIGAVAGTTTAFVTGKKDVGFAAERRLRFRLNRDISLTA